MGSSVSCFPKRRAPLQSHRDVQTSVQDDTGREAERVHHVQNEAAGVEDQTVDTQEEESSADERSVQVNVSSSSTSSIIISRSPSSVCLRSPDGSCASSSDSTSFLLLTELERKCLYESSSYWIYARTLDDNHLQSFHALDIKQQKHEHSYVPLPPYPLEELADSATAVLDKKLYVIGGRKGEFECSDVYEYDPAMYKWCGLAPTIIPRQGAVAATVDGRIYVFGGCSNQTDPWGEMYEPSTNIWTPIRRSQTLIDALQTGFDPLLRSTVLGNRIFIRSSRNGIVFDVTTSVWSPFPPNLFKYWWYGACSAAVVQNMLVTCHHEINKDRAGHEMSVQAYDPEMDAWFKLQVLDSSVHANAYRSDFMAVNGMLVIYHMWDLDHLRFLVIETSEKFETCLALAVDVLWRCWLPRFKNDLILANPAHSFSA